MIQEMEDFASYGDFTLITLLPVFLSTYPHSKMELEKSMWI